MRKPLWIIIALILLIACKSKKKSLTGDEPVDVSDFIGFFQETKLPFVVSDTQISRKLSDSLLINTKVFDQFVPDSVLKKDFGREAKPRLYAMGKTTVKEKETYLYVKAATASRQVAYIICFDPSKKFSAALPVVKNSTERNISLVGGMDKQFTINTKESRKAADGQVYYKLKSYVYNDAGIFMLIKIESNEPVQVTEIYNPIDSFPRKGKFSGDYVQDKKNFVSVRDGKDAKRIQFFVHFYRPKEDCSGELKGDAFFIKPNIAQFHQAGDPCALELNFSGNKVSLREAQGCGNHRGIRCFFEGTYWKKETKKKK